MCDHVCSLSPFHGFPVNIHPYVSCRLSEVLWCHIMATYEGNLPAMQVGWISAGRGVGLGVVHCGAQWGAMGRMTSSSGVVRLLVQALCARVWMILDLTSAWLTPCRFPGSVWQTLCCQMILWRLHWASQGDYHVSVNRMFLPFIWQCFSIFNQRLLHNHKVILLPKMSFAIVEYLAWGRHSHCRCNGCRCSYVVMM